MGMKRLAAAIAPFVALTAQTDAPTARMRSAGPAQQAPLETDTHYDARVARPAYPETHPEILFDEAHNNFHTPATRYKPFADLVASDGYRVAANAGPFTAASLAGHRILVIVNAMGSRGLDAYWS